LLRQAAYREGLGDRAVGRAAGDAPASPVEPHAVAPPPGWVRDGGAPTIEQPPPRPVEPAPSRPLEPEPAGSTPWWERSADGYGRPPAAPAGPSWVPRGRAFPGQKPSIPPLAIAAFALGFLPVIPPLFGFAAGLALIVPVLFCTLRAKQLI